MFDFFLLSIYNINLPCKGEIISHVTPSSITVPLIESKVEPTNNHTSNVHSGVRSCKQPNQIQDDWQNTDAKWNISIGHLAKRGPDDDMIRHLISRKQS